MRHKDREGHLLTDEVISQLIILLGKKMAYYMNSFVLC
jgi:hypothetical protein